MLIGKGVTIDEIKLYGETESDNILDESLPEDSFSELEAVISKVSTNFSVMPIYFISVLVSDINVYVLLMRSRNWKGMV